MELSAHALRCPVCGGALDVRVHRGVRDFEHGLAVLADFDACASCGLVAQVPTPSAAALAGYYPSDYRPHAAAARPAANGSSGRGLMTRLKEVQASRQLAALRPYLPAPDEPLLELGCGGGHFLRLLERRGYSDLTGIDRNEAQGLAFAGTSVRYRAVDLDRTLDLGGPYQAIFMNYVVEHFVSPEAVLRACKAALAPGGRVILLTPNTRALSHRVFRRYWSGLHAPRHTQLFTERNLRMLAEKVGFGRIEVEHTTDPASWTLSFQNFVQGALRKGKAPRAGTAWYSLALLPVWYPFALAERLAGRGGSMFAILYG